MARPADREPLPFSGDGRRGVETPPERLRGGGGRRPAIVGLAIVALVGIALWQPWSAKGPTPPGPSESVLAIGRVPASAAPTPSPASPSPSVSATGLPGTTRTAFYTTVTDNEWTVVALLAPANPASTEEPATQHPTSAWSSDGPFLVLQQGLTPVEAPIVRTASSAGPCPPAAVPRDRTAVPLPAGRVAYLGVTVPSGVPRPQVTGSLVGKTSGALARVPAPAVRLAGMDATTRYVIPTAGPGATVLFTLDPSAALAAGTYQFTVASPGASGDRYLYACIAP